MGRPPLELGTYGAIRIYKTGTGYRACTLARGYDGRTRPLERHGKTKAAAERALKAALRDRAGEQATGDISADARVSPPAEAWYAGLADLSPVTMQAYRDRLDRQILPGLGQLRVRELSVGVLDRHLRLVAQKHGVATAEPADRAVGYLHAGRIARWQPPAPPQCSNQWASRSRRWSTAHASNSHHMEQRAYSLLSPAPTATLRLCQPLTCIDNLPPIPGKPTGRRSR